MSGWIWCWTNNPLGSSVHWADYGGESFTKAPVFQVKQTRSNQLYLCLIPSRYLRIPAKYENMYPSRKPIKYCLADVFCQMGNPPWRKKCLPKNLAELPLPCPPLRKVRHFDPGKTPGHGLYQICTLPYHLIMLYGNDLSIFQFLSPLF